MHFVFWHDSPPSGYPYLPTAPLQVPFHPITKPSQHGGPKPWRKPTMHEPKGKQDGSGLGGTGDTLIQTSFSPVAAVPSFLRAILAGRQPSDPKHSSSVSQGMGVISWPRAVNLLPTSIQPVVEKPRHGQSVTCSHQVTVTLQPTCVAVKLPVKNPRLGANDHVPGQSALQAVSRCSLLIRGIDMLPTSCSIKSAA